LIDNFAVLKFVVFVVHKNNFSGIYLHQFFERKKQTKKKTVEPQKFLPAKIVIISPNLEEASMLLIFRLEALYERTIQT